MKIIVLKVNCLKFKVHDNYLSTCKNKQQIQHIHLLYSKVTTIFNTYTHKQTYICSTTIINHMTTTSQNNNSEHLPLSWEIVYTFKVALNNLSLTTSKYRAFGTTTTKTVALTLVYKTYKNTNKSQQYFNSIYNQQLSVLLLSTNYI